MPRLPTRALASRVTRPTRRESRSRAGVRSRLIARTAGRSPRKRGFPVRKCVTIAKSFPGRFAGGLQPRGVRSPMAATVAIMVNGKRHRVDANADTPLLYVLRNELHLHGPRFGCGLGQCGACTVHLNGKAIRSCITPVAGVAGAGQDHDAGGARHASRSPIPSRRRSSTSRRAVRLLPERLPDDRRRAPERSPRRPTRRSARSSPACSAAAAPTCANPRDQARGGGEGRWMTE